MRRGARVRVRASPPGPVRPVGHHPADQPPDSGGAGTWAKDTLFRTLTLHLIGGGPGHYLYAATVTDNGTFRTLNGAYTPNQGGSYLGDHIFNVTDGRVNGYATYLFTATDLAAIGDVPAAENGAPLNAAQTTSDWYMQAFPPGTLFGGLGILNNWRWDYRAECGQDWLDAASNSGGQSTTAGNITGFCF